MIITSDLLFSIESLVLLQGSLMLLKYYMVTPPVTRFGFSKIRFIIPSVLLFSMMLLSACTTMNAKVSNIMPLPIQTPIVVGPLANHSDTPLANRQVESITVGLLQAAGFRHIIPYPRPQSCEKLLYCPDESLITARLIQEARRQHAAFVLTGAANEWRYKVGLDGEPVAGVSLELINVSTGKTVWTGVGSAIGGTRLGLNIIGQRLLTVLLKSIIAIS